MLVETWIDFKTVFWSVMSSLSPSHKNTAAYFCKWATEQGDRYLSIDTGIIKQAIGICDLFKTQFSGQPVIDLENCIRFLNGLNTYHSARYFKTLDGCVRRGGFYWYNNLCNTEPKPIEPEPPGPQPLEPEPIPGEPPPPIPVPSSMIGQYAELLDNYLDTLSPLKIIERGIVILLRNWFRVIAAFLEWQEKRGR